ncbi:response regulator [Salinirubellus salinus]|uniref:Response regulator n=1 Tax=Salinirubellus salinus TaxID=1364945 RepID=A0A9E7R6H9_9EURY|nr:response regulator [Salinirubellus salinus]UWM56218.1 response regulator [Salinirubellus salinus]
MIDSADGPPTVLVVEDEAKLRETYQLWLEGEYEVLTAPDGETALEVADEGVDVVLLDRLMPGRSGSETLAALRERDIGAKYAMVTAVEPDLDIVEMGFDAYLTKPVDREGLTETIEAIRAQTAYSDALDEYTSLVEKRETLLSRGDEAGVREREEFQRLQARIEELDARLDESAAVEADGTGFAATLRTIDERQGEES